MKLNFDTVENNALAGLMVSFILAAAIVLLSLAVMFSRFTFSVDFSKSEDKEAPQFCERVGKV